MDPPIMASLWNEKTVCYVGGGLLTTAILVAAVRKLTKIRAAQRRAERRNNYPRNTVILHQVGRGTFAPSMSPFPLKLETYLRMANIPYQNEHGREMSAKGKTPFVTYNGEDVADSQFIIDFLNKKLEKDMNIHLSNEQRAIARAFQKMMEENFFWVIVMQRWIYNIDNWESMRKGIIPRVNPTMARFFLGRYVGYVKKLLHGHGIGRHTQEEVYAIARGDLESMSNFLGTKSFLMGDEPCEQDCAIFGMLAQARWQSVDTPVENIFNDFPSLSKYCDRMKERFWPDWDECNTADGTRKAPK